jgi:hypothetical protein
MENYDYWYYTHNIENIDEMAKLDLMWREGTAFPIGDATN